MSSSCGDDAKDHDASIFADSPVFLPVARLVLVEILFIRENLEPVQQSCRLEFPRLLRRIRDEHAVKDCDMS